MRRPTRPDLGLTLKPRGIHCCMLPISPTQAHAGRYHDGAPLCFPCQFQSISLRGLLILILRMPAVRRCAVLVSIAKYGRQKSENEDHYVRKRKHVYNYDYILRRMGTNKLYAHQTCARVFMHTPVLI